MERRIVIKVYDDGRAKVEALGFIGNECFGATQPYIEALGGEVVEEELKPEYYRTVNHNVRREY